MPAAYGRENTPLVKKLTVGGQPVNISLTIDNTCWFNYSVSWYIAAKDSNKWTDLILLRNSSSQTTFMSYTVEELNNRSYTNYLYVAKVSMTGF